MKPTQEKISGQEQILERIADAFLALNKNLEFTYCNKVAGKIVNRVPEELIGKKYEKEFPEAAGSSFDKAILQSMKEQKHIYIEDYYLPYDKWFGVNLYPSENGLSILFRDITLKKIEKDNLQLSNQRLNHHLNNTPLAVIEWDRNFIIKKWSPQAETIFGWQEAEVINKHFNDFNLVNEEDVQMVAIRAKELISGAMEQTKGINRNNTKSGSVIYCEWFNSVLRDEDGNVLSIMSLINDITKEKKAEQEILEINGQLRNLSSYLENILEEERIHIALEIHDELGQLLSGLMMDMEWLRRKSQSEELINRINGMSKLVDQTVKTVRRIAGDLRPAILDDLGLIAAIEWYGTEFELRTQIKFNLTNSITEQHFNKHINTCVFRIFQESLTNISRHSSATKINATLERDEKNIILMVHDNGKGFNEKNIKKKKTFGLIGMKERALMITGSLEINTKKNQGTTIILTVPVNYN